MKKHITFNPIVFERIFYKNKFDDVVMPMKVCCNLQDYIPTYKVFCST